MLFFFCVLLGLTFFILAPFHKGVGTCLRNKAVEAVVAKGETFLTTLLQRVYFVIVESKNFTKQKKQKNG